MRSIIELCAKMTLFAWVLYTGCASQRPGTNLVPEAANRCANPAGDGPVQPTPMLVEQGNDYLDRALRGLWGSIVNAEGAKALLIQSGICFSRALRLTPDSYEVHLSMGVGYLARARMANKGSLDRDHMVAGARHMLGRAYMLRHGAYEPLYYLAELASLEGDISLAQILLEPLRVASVKEGPVNLLLGSLSERQGKRQQAAAYYVRALEAGWPIETFAFAADRLQQLDNPRLRGKISLTRRRR